MNAGSGGSDYCDTAELRRRLPNLSKKTVERRIEDGVWRRGVHFFQPAGSQRLWKWSAIVEWIESGRKPRQDARSVEATAIQFASPVPRNGAAR